MAAPMFSEVKINDEMTWAEFECFYEKQFGEEPTEQQYINFMNYIMENPNVCLESYASEEAANLAMAELFN